MYGVNKRINFILLPVDIQHLHTICWKEHSVPINFPWHTCWNQFPITLFLDYQFQSIYLYVYPYGSTTYLDLNSGYVSPPVCLFSKTVLTILGPFHCYMNFTISLSVSLKKANWNFDGENIKLENQYGEYWNLNNIFFWCMSMECLFIYLGFLSFQQCLIISSAQVLHFLCKIYF